VEPPPQSPLDILCEEKKPDRGLHVHVRARGRTDQVHPHGKRVERQLHDIGDEGNRAPGENHVVDVVEGDVPVKKVFANGLDGEIARLLYAIKPFLLDDKLHFRALQNAYPLLHREEGRFRRRERRRLVRGCA
jgi:hypothetical protein